MKKITELKYWAMLMVILLADVLDMLDATITNIAAPLISQDLRGGASLMQWLGAGYALSMGVFLIVGGRLGDKFGQRLMFLIGVAGFTVASFLCGISVNSAMMIAARLMQGFFGALLIPQGMAIMVAEFPKEMKTKAFSLFGPILGISTIAGPIFAGMLIHWNLWGLSWRPLFLINICIGVVLFVTAFFLLPQGKKNESVILDGAGAALLSGTMLFLLYGMISGSENGWPWQALASLAMGLVLLVLFAQNQKSSVNPMIIPSLFKNRGFTSGLMIGLVFFAIANGLCFILSLYLQLGLKSTPLATSIQMVPLTVGIIIASVIGAPLIPKIGKYMIALGLMITAMGATMFWGALSQWVLLPTSITPALLVIGMGMGFCFSSLFDFAIGDVNADEAGSASGALSSVQQLSVSVGSASIASLFFYFERQGKFLMAMQTSLLVTMVASLICIGLVFLLPDQPKDAHAH